MKCWKKKSIRFMLFAIFVIGIPSLVSAETYRNGAKWVRTTEQANIRYFGEAYTLAHRGIARGTYKRDGRIVGQVTAVVPEGSSKKEDYKTVYVWDSLIPNAPKTKFYYSWR